MKINRSVYRAVEILKLLSNEKKPVTLAQITDRMDIPKSSAFDIIKTLENLDMIESIDEGTMAYEIGPQAFSIGNAYLRERDLIEIAGGYVTQVANAFNKTGFIAERSGNQVLYIYKHESEGSIITTARVGSKNYLHCTSLGKSLLAFEPNLEKAVSSIDRVQKTKYTITDERELLKELVKVRENGYAIDNRELEEHMLCIGAPIFNHKHEVIAAISISGLYTRKTNINEEARCVREAAMKISQKLGYFKEG